MPSPHEPGTLAHKLWEQWPSYAAYVVSFVTIGVIWLLSIVGASFRGHIRPDNALMLEISGLYWHFVDIVWISIFTVVYLVPVGAPAGQ